MKAIYAPKGAASEYSELALNIFNGCVHGCKYCYVPSCTFKSREVFYEKSVVKKDLFLKLESDLKEMNKNEDIRNVLFCFTTDPYQEKNKVVREVMKRFNYYGVNFTVLTKGGTNAIDDFDLYKKGDKFAVTLTFEDENKSIYWEPKAKLPKDRMEALKKAKEKGIGTWVSFEPVIEPKETYKLFELTKEYTDLYKIGKINYYKNDVNWELFTRTIIEMCKKSKKNYYIKDSLKPYLK